MEMMNLDGDDYRIECYCQVCGAFGMYSLTEKLFVDGVIKNI